MYVSVTEKRGSYFRGRCQVDRSNSVVCGMRAKGAGYNNMDGVVHLMVSPGS